MIAVKREVAVRGVKALCGRFSVERMSSQETGDKSLYVSQLITVYHKVRVGNNV